MGKVYIHTICNVNISETQDIYLHVIVIVHVHILSFSLDEFCRVEKRKGRKVQ